MNCEPFSHMSSASWPLIPAAHLRASEKTRLLDAEKLLGRPTRQANDTADARRSSGHDSRSGTGMPTNAPKKVKRPLWRRVLRAVAWSVTVIVGLIAALVVFLHTSMGQRIVRQRIEARLGERVNGTVTLETFSFRLF